MTFWGYRRDDGSVGLRNHVLILPTVSCAQEVCNRAAQGLAGAVTITNQNGCGETMGNLQFTRDILHGCALHPNVYGVVLVGIGCEINTLDSMHGHLRARTAKPIHAVSIQEEGGTLNAIAKTMRLAMGLIGEAGAKRREECSLSRLRLGLECGGSDATSGLAANPVLGVVSDMLAARGGTPVLAETSEMIGAEHLLVRRAATPEVAERIVQIVRTREAQMQALGEEIRTSQPSPGNKDGGITTLEEKSLGCIHKGGTSQIVEVVDYAKTPTKQGLVIMDTPAYDPNSVTALVAGGCQMVVFTTGRGNTLGNPIAPVVKVTANRETYRGMVDNMDCYVGEVISGHQSVRQAGEALLEELLDYMSGRPVKAEILQYGAVDTVISRYCDYL